MCLFIPDIASHIHQTEQFVNDSVIVTLPSTYIIIKFSLENTQSIVPRIPVIPHHLNH